MSGNGRSSGRDSGRDWNVGTADNYRPLNVRDALTYLDQVKVSRCGKWHENQSGRMSYPPSGAFGVIRHAPLVGCAPGGSGTRVTESLCFTAIRARDETSRGSEGAADGAQIQFSDHPDVYNRFLDVMKEFKGQV